MDMDAILSPWVHPPPIKNGRLGRPCPWAVDDERCLGFIPPLPSFPLPRAAGNRPPCEGPRRDREVCELCRLVEVNLCFRGTGQIIANCPFLASGHPARVQGSFPGTPPCLGVYSIVPGNGTPWDVAGKLNRVKNRNK